MLAEHASTKHCTGPSQQEQDSADLVDSSGPTPVSVETEDKDYTIEVCNYPSVALQLVEYNGGAIDVSKPT